VSFPTGLTAPGIAVLQNFASPLPDLGAVMIARRVAPLMQGLRGAVSSDGVASKPR
jgi:hypothetical protein